jgi:flagellar motility protein MotE (MotC chaperone)
MTTMRVLGILVAMSAVVKVVGLGPLGHAAADAASPTETPAVFAGDTDRDCGMDARGFRELLTAVRAKADELARREAELKAREAGLGAVRKLVAGEVTRLEGVARSLGITDAPGPAVSITRVYESMSADDAAPILDRLDDATLRAVLGRMRERQVGAILAAMSRERAVAVTKAFAKPAPAQPKP